jgi:DNA repair exonuclease SbcCD ATPase subunit
MNVKKLKIVNFKGINNFEIDLEKENEIRGENATGKTTVFDAYLWVLRGKNSEMASEFSVQPIGNEDSLTEVEIEIEIDKEKHSLKKTLTNKYTKKMGKSEISGKEYLYCIDGVPCRMKDFDEKIIEWFSDKFMLLSDPKYFATDSIKGKYPAWQERRQLLFSLSKMEEEKKFNGCLPDDRKKVILGGLKKINADLEQIPARIDECKRSIILVQIDKNELLQVEKSIQNAKEKLESPQLEKLYQRRQKISFQMAEDKKNATENELTKFQILHSDWIKLSRIANDIKRDKGVAKTDIVECEKRIVILEKEAEELRNKFKAMSLEKFVLYDDERICRTCGQSIPEEKIKEMILIGEQRFEESKKYQIDRIRKEGKEKVFLISELKKVMEKAYKTLEIKEVDIPERPVFSEGEIDFSEQEKQLEAIQIEINSLTKDDSELTHLENQRQKILRELAQKDANERAEKRIIELTESKDKLTKEYLQLEKEKYEIDCYIKERVTQLETTINSFFKHVKFQLFEQLQNGELKECCNVLVNTNGIDVPYNDANHAGRINAGIDIINCFSEKYQKSLPIFIDFRESVTNIIKTSSQVINLIKDESYKTLTIVKVKNETKSKKG